MTNRYEDIEDIRRLTAEYARAVDSKDLEAVAATFTRDALWDVRGFGMAEVRGIDAIRDFYSALFKNLKHSSHMSLNHIIDVDGALATGHVYILAYFIDQNDERGESIGYYSDTYVRTDEGWKFAARVPNALLPPPPPPVEA
jgi:uncharacterized protein (TIGR02246 family)